VYTNTAVKNKMSKRKEIQINRKRYKNKSLSISWTKWWGK